MTLDGEAGEDVAAGEDLSATLKQLRGLQYGVAVTLMPVSDGWRVNYFSIPDFDAEPGTTFPTFEAAIEAIEQVLPAVNTDEEKARARDELREYLRRSNKGISES
jgi:hypothetical protein